MNCNRVVLDLELEESIFYGKYYALNGEFSLSKDIQKNIFCETHFNKNTERKIDVHMGALKSQKPWITEIHCIFTSVHNWSFLSDEKQNAWRMLSTGVCNYIFAKTHKKYTDSWISASL